MCYDHVCGDVQDDVEGGDNQHSQRVVHARGGFVAKATDIPIKKPPPRAAKPSAAHPPPSTAKASTTHPPAPVRREKCAAGRTAKVFGGKPDYGAMNPGLLKLQPLLAGFVYSLTNDAQK